MDKIKISIINDEISENIDEAIAFCVENNVTYLELRSFGNKNILDMPEDALEIVKLKLSKAGIAVSAISSPLFKWNIESQISYTHIDSFNFNIDLTNSQKEGYIKRAFEVAELFEAPNIRIFSSLQNHKKPKFWELEKDLFDLAVNLSEAKNINLLLENEHTCVVNTILDIVDIEKFLDKTGIKLLFDPGNIYFAGGEVSQKELQKIVKRIKYLHVKDYSPDTSQYCPLGDGVIDYKSIIKLLTSFDEKLTISLETHSEPKFESTRKSLDNLRQLIKEIAN